jgi:ABC-type transporter Mla MlaB component
MLGSSFRMARGVQSADWKIGHMLKITYNGTASEQRWTLSGQLCGPWVAELRSAWERIRGQSRAGPCVVDLSDVTSIDERGESLLRTMKEENVRFVARGVDMKHILSHLRSKAKPSLRRSLQRLDADCDCS